MKIQTAIQFALLPVALLVIASAGCGGDDETVDPTTPPVGEVVTADDHDHEGEDHGDDHANEHNHEHGPNGLPVVTLNDGSKIEWDFDEDDSEFVVIPVNNEIVTGVMVKTVVEGDETTYEFEQQNTDEGTNWILTDQELGTAMMMGDAVQRTLIIQTSDGELTSPVAHFEGH